MILLKMIKIQADIKTEILKKTKDEKLSHFLACDIAHIIFTSDIVLDEVRELYNSEEV